MDKVYLKALCEYAERKGFQKLPVEMVINYFRSRKRYTAPIARVTNVGYPKRPMSWIEMDSLLKQIISRKNAIQQILESLGVSINEIVIGGSLSLKYQLPQFSDRSFHDIDLIITVRDEGQLPKLKDAFNTLIKAGLGFYCQKYYNENSSFMLGNLWAGCQNHPINLVISDRPPMPFRKSSVFNDPSEVIAAKKEYIKQSKKGNHRPRYKDFIDIYKCYNEPFNNELPW